jgi:YD repeat-containing protein
MQFSRAVIALALAAALLGAGDAAAEAVRYTYDAAGRIASVEYPDRDTAIFYQYDAAGNVVRRTTGTADCNGQVLPCDDGDVCTIDTCDPATGCTGTFVAGPTCSTTTTMPVQVCGDFNGDGTITATDALGVLRTAVGTGSCALSICDVDGSGSISATDALAVLRAAVGIGGPLGCGS